ncbi:hypothetical protein CEXT_259961 [Caerostris extrusa]|uniref:Uncharacterized protein n=1 Tax=Caerostris extrusa TaxID=172846 RepID=A0AAV4TPE0_CAEEX|nr:hypothetical protein CEXT_259961 [Caerostris extrusa]
MDSHLTTNTTHVSQIVSWRSQLGPNRILIPAITPSFIVEIKIAEFTLHDPRAKETRDSHRNQIDQILLAHLGVAEPHLPTTLAHLPTTLGYVLNSLPTDDNGRDRCIFQTDAA